VHKAIVLLDVFVFEEQ